MVSSSAEMKAWMGDGIGVLVAWLMFLIQNLYSTNLFELVCGNLKIKLDQAVSQVFYEPQALNYYESHRNYL